ncbi:MAG: ABC transporter permease [Paracoccaceae bacterium]|nr:peptide ABC transporter permease [Paracoccaceae bacterium]|tara:strand:+ start:285 stop:1220 length:936 start_codon:yes stop_codon:yes gene_type:complete
MLVFIIKRIIVLFLTMICLSFIVFTLVTIEPNLKKLALNQANMRMEEEAVQSWLEKHGYKRPLLVQYGEWLGNAVTGDFGYSTHFRKPVNEVIWPKVGHTGILMFWVLIITIPISLFIGVLSGMREGSKTDRSLSIFSIITTSVPQYVSGILFTIILSSWLGLFKGVAKAGNITFENFALPVLTIVVYDIGYIARMTRASMVEVMNAQYVRTARLKGMSFMSVVFKHALRNALIAPFTVIMLQFPWLLTGVVIVEKLFNYKGFGFLIVSASDQNDIDVTLACGVVAVVLVLTTQLISDIGYAFLNPRIRFS